VAGTLHVIKKAGLRPPPTQPAPRPVAFDLRHIPQYLPIDWYDTYFAGIPADPRRLRRAVPVLLARMRLGGSIIHAAKLLGLPWAAGRFAVVTIADQLRDHPGQQAAFDTALDALANALHTADHRIDYGARRDALVTWSLDVDTWRDMTIDIVRTYRGKGYAQIDWADRKRLLASVWIWTRVTEGEHHFAPLIRPRPDRPKPGSDLSTYVHSLWPFMNAACGHDHYAELRPRLDHYADERARHIDTACPRAANPHIA